MHPSPANPASYLGWSHVGFGLVLVAFNSAISQILRLRIGTSLVIAALRCMTQLFVVAVILQHVLVVKKLWAVVGIARMSLLALEPFSRV
jgi:ABC-type iron transport system FetAB permease component